MKIQYASDLHLEFEAQRRFVINNQLKPVGDILVLAGDVCYLREEHFQFEFFDYISDNWKQVYIIPGNHEFYDQSYDISSVLPSFQLNIRSNVQYINNMALEIDDTRMLFTTLWTRIKNHSAIEHGMNDFKDCIFDGRPYSTKDHNYCNQVSLQFLSQALKEETHCQHQIVVSHHVPYAVQHTDFRKGESILAEGFHVDLDMVYKNFNIDYWIHGHNHVNREPFELHGCKFVTNQLGYTFTGEHRQFDRGKVIDFSKVKQSD